MLEAAIYQPRERRFEQRSIAANGLVLLLSDGRWRAVDPPADGLDGPWVELRYVRGKIAVRRSPGSDLDVCVVRDGALCEVRAGEKVRAPAVLAAADLLIEIGSASAADIRDDWPRMTQSRQEDLPAEAMASDGAAAWRRALATITRWAAGDEQLCGQAAQLVVRTLGFDRGYVVRHDRSSQRSNWRVVAADFRSPRAGMRLDLQRFAGLPIASACFVDETPLPDGSVWAAAPWANDADGCGGFIVGVKQSATDGLHAGLVKRLHWFTQAIEAEVARRRQTQEVSRRRSAMRVAFLERPSTPTDRFQNTGTSLRREASVLWVDLTKLREAITTLTSQPARAAQTCVLLQQVVDAVAAIVGRSEGYLVGGQSDGIVALWNSHHDQPDHPERSCAAALAAQSAWEAIRTSWQQQLCTPTHLCVGVHTGSVVVANAGTQLYQRKTFGGEAIDVASAVARGCMSFDVAPLVSTELACRVEASENERLRTVCLGRTRLPGVDRALGLHLLTADSCRDALGVDEATYRSALACFEAGRLDSACRALRDVPPASPAGLLASRIERAKATRWRRTDAAHSATAPAMLKLGSACESNVRS